MTAVDVAEERDVVRSSRAVLAIVAIASGLLVGACGGDDSADEQPATRGVGEVDIDDDTVRYRSEDGEAVYELDGAGRVRVTGDEGEAVMTHGDGTELPEQWPGSLALPEELKLTSASTMTVDGQVRVNVTGEVSGEVRTVHEDLRARLVAAGFEPQGESMQDEDGRTFGTLSAAGGPGHAAVTVTGQGDSVAVSIFLGLSP